MSSTSGSTPAYPAGAWPTETFHYARKYMYLNGEAIEVLHQPAAHTDSDVFVFFRRSDVVVAGDVLDTRQFPVIDVERGGSIQGEIAALNRLVDLAVPSVPIVTREAGTIVVPGHGRLCDQYDVIEYRDMVTIIRDRVRDLVAAGRSLEQVKAANPAKGYAGRYGNSGGAWTTDRFVEAVYRSLAKEGSREASRRGGRARPVRSRRAGRAPGAAAGRTRATPSARDSAPIDLTGYWVSYVTENWRYRMVTPPKGEYRRIPVSAGGRAAHQRLGSGGGRSAPATSASRTAPATS